MKATGIVRKVDELGRIVLPIEIRNRFGIDPGDGVEIFTEDDKIILCRVGPKCVICGSPDHLVSVGDKHICLEGLQFLKKIT